MNRHLLLAATIAAACFLAPSSTAQFASSVITGSTMDLGDLSYHHFSDGTYGTTMRLGATSFSHFSDGLDVSTLHTPGLDTYTFNNGVFGSSTRLGNLTSFSFSNGLRGTATDYPEFGMRPACFDRPFISPMQNGMTTYRFNDGVWGNTLHMGDLHFHTLVLPPVPVRDAATHLFDGIYSP